MTENCGATVNEIEFHETLIISIYKIPKMWNVQNKNFKNNYL